MLHHNSRKTFWFPYGSSHGTPGAAAFAGGGFAAGEIRLDQNHEEDRHAGHGDEIADGRHLVPVGEGVRIIGIAARHARKPEEMLREEDQVDADKRHPEMQLA